MPSKRAPAEPRTLLRERAPGATAPVIVVAGDATIDWVFQTGVDWLRDGANAPGGSAIPAAARRHNWELHPGTRMEAFPGGALLLAREIALATGNGADAARVVTHRLGDPRNVPADEVLHSLAELGEFAERGRDVKGRTVYRVARFHGFTGPVGEPVRPLPLDGDGASPAIVVLDDAGNGFRDRSESWPATVRDGGDALIVLKASRRLRQNPLFEHLTRDHGKRLVVVVNADDLRAEGVAISRCLSWERTARDLAWQMRHNPDLQRLTLLPHVIVRFGVEGAVHFTAGDVPSARLYYDPLVAEDSFAEQCRGSMPGLADVFVAAVVAGLLREGMSGLRESIRDGMRASRRFLRHGFGADPHCLAYAGAEVFAPAAGEAEVIVDIAIPPAADGDAADPEHWCILNELEGEGAERLAHALVVQGERALRTVPVGVFGGLRTIDRAEIESFRSVQNLIRQYLERSSVKRPLSIAVFGPPGSGKSFGVEQVARSVALLSDARVEKMEFNLSQFEGTRDLVGALHRVRDEVLRGVVPLVFFDEFDSDFDGSLGWLRYFLAPMQDGVFRDGPAIHPIGKAIFVFAGGMSSTFAHFSRDVTDAALGDADRAADAKRFREAKGPDFVSRLRGHVNVLGPNPDSRRPGERLYMIRRAMVLRSLLQRNWSWLVDREDPAIVSVDHAVLRALIGVPAYKHGVRSLEAVLEMSMLEGRTVFEPAALPALEQLEQHVDADAFARLVLQGVLFTAARDAIAEAIHDKYRADHADRRTPDDPALRPWPVLSESLKRSNRGQAADIIRKLEAVRCGYRPGKPGARATTQFTEKEIGLLAELEHERWMEEKLAAGYAYGPERSEERKTNPGLVPWAELPENMRQSDRDTVAAIPHFMARAGFEVYRL